MIVLLILFLTLIVVAVSLQNRVSNEDRIREFIEEQGGTVISMNRDWVGEVLERDDIRHYECEYRDKNDELQTRRLKINFWKDVSFVE